MRTRTLLCLSVVALLAAACQKDDPTLPVPVESSNPPEEAAQPGQPAAPPIEDSAAVRDALLEIAQANAGTEPGDDGSFGVLQAWSEAYPDLSFVGYAIPPDESTVPVYANVPNSKDVPSEDNPYLLAFAVLGTDGVCSGGLGAGYPTLTFAPVDFAGEEQVCEPLTIAAIGGYPID